ncbi:chymotrypsin-like elastase family member 2A [Chiloscyllium plagiosum]|uniref:chymotrypsin-like elastase family member 2A n=1 Tax=Chiloscyllium plagiosum TaxID=36176 RepID=UPI001CB7B0D4|nr:chymotrypsin-like elastase family member 2A [Chiloscyllium plagiosum]
MEEYYHKNDRLFIQLYEKTNNYTAVSVSVGPVAASPLTGRVVAGQEAKPHSWPWQASLQFAYESDPDFFQHLCGGTLISGNWVMTAAHCIVTIPGRFAVILGEHNLEQKGNEYLRHVQLIITHPYWNPNSLENGNDIALLRLKQPAYATPDVAVALLPPFDQVLPNGYPCYITGWGLTQPFGVPSSTLQQALLQVVDYKTCSSPSWWSSAITENMVCAGGDGVTAGCQGDSGGPLNCLDDTGMWVVHGIVSFGPVSCVMERYPTVFTRVSAYMDWIMQTMQQYGGEFR